MKKIKSFIYLDNYKMYSISSQLFEGLTDYIISSKSKQEEEIENQEGPKNSGHILADIIKQSASQTEKRFLHDYSYTLFEDALTKEDKVLEIDIDNIDDLILDTQHFVKIRGRIIFNDTKMIQNTIARFNDLGYSIGYVSGYHKVKDELDKLNEKIASMKDRNEKAKSKAIVDAKFDIKNILKSEGLQMNPEFLSNLSYVLDYGFEDSLEIQIPFTTDISHYLFSSVVDRQMLKESESNIIRKYARETEKEFVVFGILTQTQTWPLEKLKAYNKDLLDPNPDLGMKESVMNFVAQLGNLEKTFIGKLDYEYIIDPIAIYREI
jgi:hypothetical protein